MGTSWCVLGTRYKHLDFYEQAVSNAHRSLARALSILERPNNAAGLDRIRHGLFEPFRLLQLPTMRAAAVWQCLARDAVLVAARLPLGACKRPMARDKDGGPEDEATSTRQREINALTLLLVAHAATDLDRLISVENEVNPWPLDDQDARTARHLPDDRCRLRRLFCYWTRFEFGGGIANDGG